MCIVRSKVIVVVDFVNWNNNVSPFVGENASKPLTRPFHESGGSVPLGEKFGKTLWCSWNTLMDFTFKSQTTLRANIVLELHDWWPCFLIFQADRLFPGYLSLSGSFNATHLFLQDWVGVQGEKTFMRIVWSARSRGWEWFLWTYTYTFMPFDSSIRTWARKRAWEHWSGPNQRTKEPLWTPADHGVDLELIDSYLRALYTLRFGGLRTTTRILGMPMICFFWSEHLYSQGEGEREYYRLVAFLVVSQSSHLPCRRCYRGRNFGSGFYPNFRHESIRTRYNGSIVKLAKVSFNFDRPESIRPFQKIMIMNS